MSLTVTSNYTGSVHTDSYRQEIQRHIMYQLVKRPLQECRIYSNNRMQSARSHTCGKGHRMFLSYADIKETVRESLGPFLKPGTVSHSSSYSHNI